MRSNGNSHPKTKTPPGDQPSGVFVIRADGEFLIRVEVFMTSFQRALRAARFAFLIQNSHGSADLATTYSPAS